MIGRSESPKPEKKSRAERLQNIVSKKQSLLGSLTHDRDEQSEYLESFRSGGLGDFFTPNYREIEGRKEFGEALKGLVHLCDAISGSDDPEARVRTLIEILIQKDHEWIETDAANDLRSNFFSQYFYLKDGTFLDIPKVLNELRLHRSDDDFIKDVATEVGAIKARFSAHLERAEGDIKRDRADSAETEDSRRLHTDFHAQQVEALDARIIRTQKKIEHFSNVLNDETKPLE